MANMAVNSLVLYSENTLSLLVVLAGPEKPAAKVHCLAAMAASSLRPVSQSLS